MGFFARRRDDMEKPQAGSATGADQSSSVEVFSGDHEGPPMFPEPGARAFDDLPLWFPRLRDIPNLAADLPKPNKQTQLLGVGERPWVYFGKGLDRKSPYKLLMWPGTVGLADWEPDEESGYGHNWSPAHRSMYFGVEQGPGRSADEIVEELWPTLELPGTGLDYHFLLQGAVAELWKLRDANPAARAALVRIATIDRQLVEALPETMALNIGKADGFLINESLERLAAVYEQLGDLDAAFEVTTFALRFDQLEPRHRRLAKKLGQEPKA